MRLRGVLGPAAAVMALAGTASHAGASSVWIAAGTPPLPENVRSVRVLRRGEPIYVEPVEKAARRGVSSASVLLPLYAARTAPGCQTPWLQVDPAGWVCGDVVELSPDNPLSFGVSPWNRTKNGLPFEYFFVGPDGSYGYKRLVSADIAEPDTQLEPGFALAVVERRAMENVEYFRTHSGLWVPARDLFPARPATLAGEALTPEQRGLDLGWVVEEQAPVLAAPQAFARRIAGKVRFDRVDVKERRPGFVRIDENAWIEAKYIRQPTAAAPPDELDVQGGEHWIDVEIATQTLVAYEGATPVFATLVSTGRGREGAYNATPKGNHRIWVKLFVSNMDNLEEEDAGRYYRMEDVPWVQYFSKGFGLHGAFWHRGFGHVRSHGCINLAPMDAERLFQWTSPHLPAGWTAALPSPYERGTLVRVR